ncbi:glutamate dehydrogenase [Pseudomonas sp. BAY1663]|nr:glutamate dehydrogenase [Pseudomonas sp. BAY1663]
MIETVDAFLAQLKQRDPHQPEFHQAVEEVVRSLWSFLAANPRYMQAGILERMVEPERAILFRVPGSTIRAGSRSIAVSASR